MARVGFIGSKAAGLATLRSMTAVSDSELAAVITCDDRSDQRSVLPEFEDFAGSEALPLMVSGGSGETEELVAASGATLVLVSGWYRRIAVERCPDTTFFGFHASPLPRYRGGAPIVWQIIAGEPSVGLSFFQFTAGLDDGDLVAQRSFELGPDDTVADVLDWLAPTSAELTSAYLPQLIAGTATLTPQDHSKATYCAQRTPEDGLIDWRQDAPTVHNFIRAQTAPYPGAFSRLADGSVVRFLRSSLEPRDFLGQPGAVAERGDDYVAITCGSGAIRAHLVQLDGGEPQPAAAVLRSLSTRLA
jgi:methionyl-tRNA formyltransferase